MDHGHLAARGHLRDPDVDHAALRRRVHERPGGFVVGNAVEAGAVRDAAAVAAARSSIVAGAAVVVAAAAGPAAAGSAAAGSAAAGRSPTAGSAAAGSTAAVFTAAGPLATAAARASAARAAATRPAVLGAEGLGIGRAAGAGWTGEAKDDRHGEEPEACSAGPERFALHRRKPPVQCDCRCSRPHRCRGAYIARNPRGTRIKHSRPRIPSTTEGAHRDRTIPCIDARFIRAGQTADSRSGGRRGWRPLPRAHKLVIDGRKRHLPSKKSPPVPSVAGGAGGRCHGEALGGGPGGRFLCPVPRTR